MHSFLLTGNGALNTGQGAELMACIDDDDDDDRDVYVDIHAADDDDEMLTVCSMPLCIHHSCCWTPLHLRSSFLSCVSLIFHVLL